MATASRAKVDATEAKWRARMRSDFPFYARNNLKIAPAAGGLVPFVLNRTQRHLNDVAERQLRERGFVRIITVKARKEGVSTWVAARYYHKVTNRTGVNAFVLSHASDTTRKLFELVRRYHENSMEAFKPGTRASNSTELKFEGIDTSYSIGTAGTEAVGRGSTIQYLHGSETGFWPNAETHTSGILRAVPSGAEAAGTEIVLESTGNGIDNVFHNMWRQAVAGESLYEAVFIPWYWHDTYRLPVPDGWVPSDFVVEYGQRYDLDREQLYWMEMERASFSYPEWQFPQEYPGCPEDAFQSVGANSIIPPDRVMRARLSKPDLVGEGPVILGADIARSVAGDKNAFIVRQGRKVTYMEQFHSRDLTVTADRVAERINSDLVDKAFVDGSTGAGVVDVLRRRGYGDRVTAVMFGGIATNSKRFKNKRSEMYWRMREWFEDEPVEIPNHSELHAALVTTQYNPQQEGPMVLESKDAIKKREGGSPDLADALALTFAFHVNPWKRAGRAKVEDSGYDVDAWLGGMH